MQHHLAHAAAALPPGYSLTMTESTSTMTYGGTAPTFQAHLTVPADDDPLKSPSQFFFLVDSQSFASDGSGGSGSTYTFTLKGSSVAAALTLSVGSHTAVAKYFSSVLNETLESAPVTFTVQKRTPALLCNIDVVGVIFAANAPVQFTMGTQNGPAIDWEHGTYSVTFVGPQTFTHTNLTVDGFGQGTVLAPTAPGKYRYQCAFSGTDSFNAAQTALSSVMLLVTQGHQPVIKLYSNPTTIEAGQIAILDIVIAGGPGLPTPTGQITLFLGPYSYTNQFNLGSGGSVTLQIRFPSPLPSNTLRVNYSGDAVYAVSSANFSLTNPPIPGGSNPPPPNPTATPISTTSSAPTPTPSGGSTPAPSSTPAAGSTPIPSGTTIANSGTTSNDGTTPGSQPANAVSSQGMIVFWMVLMVLLVLAAGGSGAFIVLRKRAGAASASATSTLPPSEDGEEQIDG